MTSRMKHTKNNKHDTQNENILKTTKHGHVEY